MEEENELCLIYFSFSIKSMTLIAVRNLFRSGVYFMSYSLHKYFPFFFSSFLLLHFDVCSQSHGNGTKAYRPMERRRYGKVLAPSPPPPASHQIHSVGVCEWQQSNRNGRVLLHIGVNNTKMRERNQIRVWLLLCSGRRTLFNSSTAGSH